MKPILINLDLKIDNYNEIELKQGCNDVIVAIISDLGESCDLTGQVISVEMLKADKTFIIQSNDIVVNNNNITIKLHKDFTRASGNAKLQIKMVKDNVTGASWVVNCIVRKSAIDQSIGESKNVITIKEDIDASITRAIDEKDKTETLIARAIVENAKTENLITTGGAATKGQLNILETQLAEKASKNELQNVSEMLNGLNTSSNLLTNEWSTTSPSSFTISNVDGILNLNKVNDVSSQNITVKMTKDIILNKIYELKITAKTNVGNSITKDLFFKDSVGYCGNTVKFRFSSEYKTETIQFMATKSTTATFGISSNGFGVGEIVNIKSIELKELSYDSNILNTNIILFNPKSKNLESVYFQQWDKNIVATSLPYDFKNEGLEVTVNPNRWIGFKCSELPVGNYEINIIAKSSLENSNNKNFFVTNSNYVTTGESDIFKLTTTYQILKVNLVIKKQAINYLFISASNFNDGETIYIEDIFLNKIIDKNFQNVNYKRIETQVERQLFEYPKFTKISTNPIFTKDKASWVSSTAKIYFPCIINAQSILGDNAIDKYYLYYSTDHADDGGGIGLATSSSVEGNWTDYGRVYVDTFKGVQTETPWVVWNKEANKFFMYYHNNYYQNGDIDYYRSQATCLATSSDGVNWERHSSSPIIKIPDIEFPGDGHSGYARVFRIGDKWIMYHLMGGTNYSHFGISYSKDGISWQTDPRPLCGNADSSEDSTSRKFEMSATTPFLWRGQMWAIYVSSPHISGTVSETKRIYVAPFISDRKIANLYKAIEVGGEYDWDGLNVQWATVIEDNGKLYIIYEGKNKLDENSFGVAVSEVL